MMSPDNKQVEPKEESLTKKPLTKEHEDLLNTISSISAVAGLTVSVLAALELSVPVMVIAAIAGATSAVSKLFASKHSAQQVEETASISDESEQAQKENNSALPQ
jgi:hypothetical protein